MCDISESVPNLMQETGRYYNHKRISSRLKSTGATKIKVTPVNANQQVSGGTLYFSSTGTKYSSMTNTNWNTIKLYIQNNNGGTNIESSGSWTNSAS